MKVNLSIKYDIETQELIINGQSKGKMQYKDAANIIKDFFRCTVDRKELDLTIKKAIGNAMNPPQGDDLNLD